jgi:hypothetical protein
MQDLFEVRLGCLEQTRLLTLKSSAVKGLGQVTSKTKPIPEIADQEVLQDESPSESGRISRER